ncbi:hypothetical protein A9D14_12195 [Croceicoccus marinus]|uniref:Uncharacterized protein n=1 Tax=Croceicoccus marinus TaxID=450378 RepID=A0A1Z1FDK6_9SPHN|nr:hypothetical protein A9D14_12195 [Croceicoccus marinus]
MRAGGAVGGAFAGLQMPPTVLTGLLADVGLGAEAGVTPVMAAMALAALGLVFGLLVGAAIAGVLPEGVGEAVGTREDAAASVPRLRRHLAEGQGYAKKTGTPLERLSAPPTGQRLPKHDLSHIPPAPKDDEITFERIPNTGFYADIESPVKFEDDGDDLARFALPGDAVRADEDAALADDWDAEDDWTPPGSATQKLASPAHDDHPPAETAPPAAAEPQKHGFAYGSEPVEAPMEAESEPYEPEQAEPWPQAAKPIETARVYSLQRDTGQRDTGQRDTGQRDTGQRDTGHDGHSAPRFAPGLTGGMESDWFAGEADEEEDADDDGAGYGSLMAIGLGKTHKARPQAPTHRPGEANLSPMPLLDADRVRQLIPNGAGPQDFRLREALEELKRV